MAGRFCTLAALYGALDELHARAVVVRRAAEAGEADDGEAARRGAEIGVFEGLCDVVLAPVHDDAEDDAHGRAGDAEDGDAPQKPRRGRRAPRRRRPQHLSRA